MAIKYCIAALHSGVAPLSTAVFKIVHPYDYRLQDSKFLCNSTNHFFFERERELESAHKSWFVYRKSLTKYVNSNHLAFLKQMSP